MVNVYFLDSSALVKRYVAEAGSAWIQMITAPQTADDRLIAAAQAEGLTAESPNAHQ